MKNNKIKTPYMFTNASNGMEPRSRPQVDPSTFEALVNPPRVIKFPVRALKGPIEYQRLDLFYGRGGGKLSIDLLSESPKGKLSFPLGLVLFSLSHSHTHTRTSMYVCSPTSSSLSTPLIDNQGRTGWYWEKSVLSRRGKVFWGKLSYEKGTKTVNVRLPWRAESSKANSHGRKRCPFSLKKSPWIKRGGAEKSARPIENSPPLEKEKRKAKPQRR